ncbi:MAG: LysE family translocator [Pseudomonadota bacterium]
MLDAYLITLFGVMAAQASPGPNLVAVASVSLSQGRKKGLFVVSGVASGMLIWSVATAYGLATVLEVFPYSLTAMRLIGGGYLLWLALKGLRAVFQDAPGTINPSKSELTNLQAWMRGLLVLLTNPKAVMMWAAVATFLFGAGLTAEQVLLFGPLGAISGFVIYGAYAFLFSTDLANRGYRKFSRWIELIFSASFGALGGKLVLDGIKELKQ